MDIEEKVDDVRDMLHEMKPIVAQLARSTEQLDVRARTIEIKQGEQDIKITRVQSDLDGLGRKVRAQRDRQVHGPAGHDEAGGRWLAFLEVMAAAPKWAHVVVTFGSLATTAAVILARHWPR